MTLLILLLLVSTQKRAFAESGNECEASFFEGKKSYLADSSQGDLQDLSFILLGDSGIRAKIESNPYLGAYLVSLHSDLDPALSGEIKQLVRERFIESSQQSTSPEELDKLEASVQAKLADPETLRQAKLAVETAQKKQASKERRAAMANQFRGLPATVKNLKELVDTELKTEILDANLWAFRGFHNEPKETAYAQRPWEKVSPKGISVNDIERMDPKEFAAILQAAIEIEDPILNYSKESGTAFAAVLPNLGRFMGKTDEQMRKAQAEERNWCESPWCAEEKRHGNALARVKEQITGEKPSRDNPNPVGDITRSEADALHHIDARESTEWNASSAYMALAAHAKGDTRDFLMNIDRDEIKHLTIVSNADRYLYGGQANRRLISMVKVALRELSFHQKDRSSGDDMLNNPLTAVEAVIAHLLVEIRMRQYMSTIPLKTLAMIYDGPSNAPIMEAFDLSPAEKKDFEEQTRIGKEKRESLARWTAKDRARAIELREFESKHAALLADLIATQFNGFAGAENYDSELSRKIVKQIKSLKVPSNGLSSDETKLARKSLFDSLRDFQIRNNLVVRNLKNKPAKSVKPAASEN